MVCFKKGKEMNKSIIVLGMHRSGTSLIAGILQRLGVYMGSVFRIPDEHNKDGYFEDLDWRCFNNWVLRTAGGTWYDPPSNQAIWDATKRLSLILGMLIRMKDEQGLWGFKDPRTCLTVAALHGVSLRMTAPRYIFVTRTKNDIIRSLQIRAKKRGYYETGAHWEALTNAYLDRANKFFTESKLVDRGRVTYVSYTDMVKSNERRDYELKNLLQFLGLPEQLLEIAAPLVRVKEVE
jgi:hypothetical protein